jgi:hypothetical protein
MAVLGTRIIDKGNTSTYRDGQQAVYLLKIDVTETWYTNAEKAIEDWEWAVRNCDTTVELWQGRSPSQLQRIR